MKTIKRLFWATAATVGLTAAAAAPAMAGMAVNHTESFTGR